MFALLLLIPLFLLFSLGSFRGPRFWWRPMGHYRGHFHRGHRRW